MKKLLSIILLAILLFTFISCGGNDEGDVNDTMSDTVESVESTEDTAPETVNYDEALNDDNWSINY